MLELSVEWVRILEERGLPMMISLLWAMTNVSVSAFGNANGGVVAGSFETRWRIEQEVGAPIFGI